MGSGDEHIETSTGPPSHLAPAATIYVLIKYREVFMATVDRNFAAFVITYNRAEILGNTLDALLSQTLPPEKIIVIDNASGDHTREVVQSKGPTVLYQRLPINSGPAGGANAGLKWGLSQKYDWLYWGDDDDPPQDVDTFERLMNMAAEKEENPVGAVGEIGALWDWKQGRLIRLADDDLHGYLSVDFIAGGAQLILNMQAVNKIGLPNPDYFFGLEDFEYSLRLRLAGYSLLVDGDTHFRRREQNGNLGLMSRSRLQARRPGEPRTKAVRQYYSTRNYINMMRNVFQRPDLARNEVLKSCFRAGQFVGQNPKAGIQYAKWQIMGIAHGYLNKLGHRL